jgi:hypothetical protein
MDKVKRYSPAYPNYEMHERKNGAYVKHVDYEELLKENRDLKAQLKQLNAGGFWD